MSRLLIDLLDVDSKKFHDYISRLETAALRPGVDLKLEFQIRSELQDALRKLNLDVSDTTAEELFYALKQKLGHDDTELVSYVAQHNGDDFIHKLSFVVSAICAGELCVSITAPGVRRLLVACPPKRTIKLLRCRSLESMLKRYDPRILYVLSTYVENESWKRQISAKIRRLSVKDVQLQPVSCLVVPKAWYERVVSVLGPEKALVNNSESGTVLMMPILNEQNIGSTTLLLGLALYSARELAVRTLSRQAYAMTAGNEHVLDAQADLPLLHSIHGLIPSWNVVYELLASRGDSVAALGQLVAGKAETDCTTLEKRLTSLIPVLDFWDGLFSVGMTREGVAGVSCHLLDVATSVITDATYAQRSVSYMQSSLWDRLHSLYLQEDVFLAALVSQIEDHANFL